MAEWIVGIVGVVLGIEFGGSSKSFRDPPPA